MDTALAVRGGQAGCRERAHYQQLTSSESVKGKANPAPSHASSCEPNKRPLACQGRPGESQPRSGISAESAAGLVHGPAPLHHQDAPLVEGKLEGGRERERGGGGRVATIF